MKEIKTILLAVLLLLAQVAPLQAQAEPEAREMKQRAYLPTMNITNPFGGSVTLECPVGTDAHVLFKTLVPVLPGTAVAVWFLHSPTKNDSAIYPLPFLIFLHGAALATFDLKDPDWRVVRMAWFSFTPLVVTGSGCFLVDLPEPNQ